MALDPRQTFGKLGPTAMNAPGPAKLVPQQTIQGATLAGQAFDKLGDTISNVGDQIRKSGTIIDRQQMDERNAERTRLSVEAQGELDAEEVQQGRKYNVEELSTKYKEKLTNINSKLADKYKFAWAGDEADSESKNFMELAQANFQKQKVQPRQSELNRDSLLGESDQLNKSGQAALVAGRTGEAMEFFQQAGAVWDKPVAAATMDASQRTHNKELTMKNGVVDVHSKMKATDVVKAIDTHLELEKSAAALGKPELLQASPYRNVDPSFLMQQRDKAVERVDGEIRIEKARVAEIQARDTDIFENTYTVRLNTAIAKGNLGELSKLEHEMAAYGKTNIETGGKEGPKLDAITRVQGSIINARERIIEKAEARAARAESKRLQVAQLNAINAQNRGAALGNSEDQKNHDKAYDLLLGGWQKEKLPADEQVRRTKDWIAEKNYIPDTVRQRIEGGLNSPNPAVVKQALGEMKTVVENSPQVRPQFSKQAEFYYAGSVRGSASIEQTTENWKQLGKRTDQETARAQTQAREETKDDKEVIKLMRKGIPDQRGGIGSWNRTPDGLEAKDAKNPEVSVPYSPQSISDWRNSYEQHRAYLPKEAATEAANRDTFGRGGWSTSMTTGTPILRKGQPRSFGIPDQQLESNLAEFRDAAKLPPGTPVVLEPYKMTKTGDPAYHVKYLNKDGLYVYHKTGDAKSTIIVSSDRGVAKPDLSRPAGALRQSIPETPNAQKRDANNGY